MDSYKIKYVKGKIGAEEYWANTFNEFSFDNICDDCDDLIELIKTTLHKGFASLNNLDRSNRFWDGTNGLATIHKLHDYARYLIVENIEPTLGAWLNISVSLIGGQQHLVVNDWKILKENNELNPKWLVFSAWSMSAYWAYRNINELSKIIIELDNYSVVSEAFGELINTQKVKNLELEKWVSDVKNNVEQAHRVNT